MAKKSRQPSRKLHLEALEQRCTPSCIVYQRGTTLYVLGDRTDNRVMITESADNAVHVECDTDTPADFAGVNKIVLKTGDGQDFVTLSPSPDATVPIALDADFGLGDDEANLTCSGPAKINFGSGDDVGIVIINNRPGTIRSAPALDVKLGNGDDVGIVVIDGLPDGSQTINFHGGDGADEMGIVIVNSVPADGSYKFNIYGDRGDDQSRVEVLGPVAGSLGIEYHGGDGSDQGIVIVNSTPVDGSLQVNFHGDRGDDDLSMEANGLGVAGRFTSNFHGGYGNDDLGIIVGGTVAAGAGLTCRLDGWSGNDDLRADVAGIEFLPGTAPKGTAEFDFHGGAGNDTELARLLNPAMLMGVDPMPEPPPQVVVNMWGDAGQDFINFEATGELDGELMLHCNGGSHRDTIQTLFDIDPRSRSTVNAQLFGGLSQDFLTALSFGVSTLSCTADGFAGFDTAHITRNVATRGCEEVFFVE